MTNIKVFLSLFLTVFCIALFSCNSTIKAVDKDALSSLIDGYFQYYGEYPSSLESFLSFYEEQDSVSCTISYFEKNEKCILWDYKNPNILQEELVVKFKNKVLYDYQGKKHFSFLDNLINAYENDYLEYPSSLQDLMRYNTATIGKKEVLFDRCITRTLDYLAKYNEQITWTSNDTMFLMISGNDTIDYRLGPSYGISLCSTNYWREKFIFLFYDKQFVYIPNDDLENKFKMGLQKMRYKYKMEQFDILEYHLLKYEPKTGLLPLCKNDDVTMETEWFHDINDYMYNFCDEHCLGRIIFVSPSYHPSHSSSLEIPR